MRPFRLKPRAPPGAEVVRRGRYGSPEQPRALGSAPHRKTRIASAIRAAAVTRQAAAKT
jgi:hypothetical protein